MKHLWSFCIVIFCLICLTMCIAASPILYDFEIWNGAGSASVFIKENEGEFIKLTYLDQDVDQDFYTVEDRQGEKILTLQEGYLKSLNLENGEYPFYAYFEKDNLEIGNSTTMLDNDQMKLTIDMSPFEVLSREEIVSFRLTYGEEEIDPSHYKVETGELNTVVTFEEGFLETLSGKETFTGYTTYKKYTYFTMLKLKVDIESMYTAPLQTDPVESLQEQSPKTGYDAKQTAPTAFIVLLMAAGCIIVLEGLKKTKKKD